MPRSAALLRQLQSLLEVTAPGRGGGDLDALLAAIARAISESLGFGTVVINLYRAAWDDFAVVAVHGSEPARELLEGTTGDARAWEQLLDERFQRRGAYFVPHDQFDWSRVDEHMVHFVPSLEPASEEGAWHPEDALFVLLRAAGGELLGIVSVDEPASRRRPSDDELEQLVALAAHAARAIESAQEAERASRHGRSLEQLMKVSSELSKGDSTSAVLQRVCEGIAQALDFGHVVIELADRESDRYRPAAGVGIDLAEVDVQLPVAIDALDGFFVPELEIEGCYLASREEALARVGAEPDFASTKNGRGPRAWNRHWLLVPLNGRDGERVGFIWVDDPLDFLLPSHERLQALRLFADQAATALESAAQLERLRESNETREAAMSASPVAIFTIDADLVIRSWNAAAERLYGWSADEVVGKPYRLADERGLRQVEGLRQRVLAGESIPNLEVRRIRKDGTTVELMGSAAPLRDGSGNVTGAIVIHSDISERKRAERALERQNQELSALHEMTLGLIERLDLESLLSDAVARACGLLGTEHGYLYLVDPETDVLRQHVGTGIFEGYLGSTCPRGEGLSGRVWETGEPLAVDAYADWAKRLRKFDGAGWRAVAGVPLRSRNEVVGVLGVGYQEAGRRFDDADLALLERLGRLASIALENARLYEAARQELDERRQAEVALQKSQELYRRVVENSTDLIFLLDLQCRVLYASPSTRTVLGYEVLDLIGRSIADLLHPDDLLGAQAAIAEAVQSNAGDPHVARVRHQDGRWLLVEGSAATIMNEAGQPEMILSVSRDVTERRRAEQERRLLEDELRQAQKMEAVGRLAGGIAHDFNNILTAIGGYGQLALETLSGDDERVRRHLEEMMRASDRAAALTRQLLAFSRKQVLQPRLLDLNAVVREVESMLARLIGADVELQTSLAGDLAHTHADPSQIEQVVVNLAVNARDAMPGGGRVLIETANVELDEEFAARHPGSAPGAYVVLKVSDTGGGMDESMLERVFEPFFTTKKPGEGTGLGLSTVYGIVKQSDGFVTVESEPGEGTSFTVYLPQAVAAAEPGLGDPTVSPESTGAGGSETVLLVEDEEIVRALVREMLENLGYTVVDVEDGERALTYATDPEAPVDLLISDVVMPRMGGLELSRRLAELRPGTPVLLISGYPGDSMAGHGPLAPGTAFLEKPFSSQQLTERVRQLLDRRSRATRSRFAA